MTIVHYVRTIVLHKHKHWTETYALDRSLSYFGPVYFYALAFHPAEPCHLPFGELMYGD